MSAFHSQILVLVMNFRRIWKIEKQDAAQMKRSLYAIMVPFFSTVEDFVTKGKVPVVCRPFLQKRTD